MKEMTCTKCGQEMIGQQKDEGKTCPAQYICDGKLEITGTYKKVSLPK